MFSFRRKPKKEPESPRIRTSPSLPELNSQGIPWPEELVDVQAIREELPSPVATSPSKGAAKTSFQADAVQSFHKPFRPSGKGADGGPISSIYMAGPTPAFDKHTHPPLAGRFSQRRARIPPTFNLMVVGGKGTGKTSLLRLLLETAETSPSATMDQKAAVERFLKGSTKTTPGIQTACIEIYESRFDRVLFSVIDTPGLDFLDGRELKLERQVNGIIKYIDAQYADTMNEESKVVRQSKGDQHIHLCIYMIDPASIMTATARRAQSLLPKKTHSETTVSASPPDLVPDTSSGDDSDSDEEEGALIMSPAEIRVIRRLSARSNVLPVIARADSLTDEKLTAVKQAVRTGLAEADIDFGVFGPSKKGGESAATPRRKTHFANGNGTSNADAIPEVPESPDSEDGDDERQSRPVIKLRPTRHRALSRSRSRRDLSQAAADDDPRRPTSPDANDRDSVANVRFSAHIIAKADLNSLLPFALITPEHKKRQKATQPRPTSTAESTNTISSPISPSQYPLPSSDDDHGTSAISSNNGDAVPETPASIHSSHGNFTFLNTAPPDALKGVFVRKFRWGTIDVLNPDHCDFAALRTAVLSTHLKLLKVRTKEVLYEQYRTEKLLARRATSHITDEERERLLEELGL